MVVIRSINEIILSMIDFYKITLPDADSKPGTVIRDLLIDAPANQLALLYDELSKVSIQQSLRLVLGSDLDKLAKNFGLTRKSSTTSSGVALLSFASIPATINVNKGDLIIASNGFSFAVSSGLSVLTTQLNFYKSIASKYRNDLDFLGITDQYAVQVSTQATSPGSSGNIQKYALTRTTIAGVSNVTNVNSFNGGNDQEDDATFRNRILSVFSGSSIGTALGYKNTALATTGVIDAFVVEPGSPLMIRDGSIVNSDGNGNLTVVSEGTGGKVDVVILGTTLTENTDSYIYRDLSNNNDPTNSKNIVVLGQISGDENKTINRRRIDDLANGTLPAQPVNSLLQITGSSSGSNFQPKSVDSFGRVSGNYELINDTGSFAGSPFGFDSFRWTSDRISLFNEDKVKGKFNGQDSVTFTDVLAIPEIQQNISITNENSLVLNSDRSLIQLLHVPASTVTRVFNTTTGERYTVVSQNPNDDTSSINTSGVIKISGSTLPSQSDILQVDYNWVVTFDQYSDYDGRSLTNNKRDITDSVDWGYSNLVRSEKITLTRNTSNTFFNGTTSAPISSVVSALTFTEIGGIVTQVASGTFAGRFAVILNNLIIPTVSVDSIIFKNSTIEIYNTPQNDGSFSNASFVFGSTLKYITTIILPNDSNVIVGDNVKVTINSTDIFNTANSTGNSNNNQVTIPVANLDTVADNIIVNLTYIANIQNNLSASVTSLPFSRVGNGFITSSNIGFNNVFASNIFRKEHQLVQKNLSNQFYLEISPISTDTDLEVTDIISVIRLSDNLELWNNDFPGTITTNNINNKYQLILNGFNTPVAGDRALVIFKATDTQRFQNFTFDNKIIETQFASLQEDVVSGTFTIPIHTFTVETSIHFQIVEPNTDIVLASGTDGYLTVNADPLKCNFASPMVNFSNILDANSNVIDITSKKIRLVNCLHINNTNTYDVISFNVLTNFLIIENNFSKLNNSQISITRISDGKELWSDLGTIDTTNNLLSFANGPAATVLDKIYVTYFTATNLKQAPSKLILNVTDQVVNTGILSIVGTTIGKAEDIVFSTTTTSLKQNLLEAIKKGLGLNSNASIPSNVKLIKIAKLERVTTTNSTSDEVLISKINYDILGTSINDNSYFLNDFVKDNTLSVFDFVLPPTDKNITNLSAQTSSGDKFRVTFYYATSNDSENVSFTRNGSLYTNKSFAFINNLYVSSGFNSSQSAKLVVSTFNQPVTGSRYKVFYDYLAPKPNERIIIKYNYNKLISDVTFNIEANRPINADVLARAAKQVLIDVTLNIVISSQFKTSSALVLQNVKDKIISAINTNSLGINLDSSSLINAAFSVEGVAGARVVFFNKTGNLGQVLSIQAQDDEYFGANLVTVNSETR